MKTSLKGSKFLCHLNRDLDRDTNCKVVAKTLLKEKSKEKILPEKQRAPARWHGSIDLFV
jgi:hypothetical protein